MTDDIPTVYPRFTRNTAHFQTESGKNALFHLFRMCPTVSAKIEDELVEFLDTLVIKGYADSRSSGIRFCLDYAAKRMDRIEDEQNRRIIKQRVCGDLEMKD